MDEALIDVKLANLGKVWGLRSVRPLLLPTASELTPPSSLSGWISLCLAMGTERSQKDNVKRKIPGVGVGNMISGLRIPGKRLSSEVIPVGGGWGRAPWEPRQCPPCTPRGGGGWHRAVGGGPTSGTRSQLFLELGTSLPCRDATEPQPSDEDKLIFLLQVAAGEFGGN